MSTLIKNCRALSPDVDISQATVEIEGESIKAVHENGASSPMAESVFDAEGRMAVPGFIDIHIHGAQGFDVCDGTLEAVEAIAESKLQEGVTTFCPTTLTLPEEGLVKVMHAVASYSENESFARCAGVHLEGPYINAACVGAQNPAHVRIPDINELARLRALAKISIVTFAVETEGGFDFLRHLVEAGIVPSLGHTGATYNQFLGARREGLKHLTHFCNQMTKLHHREIGLVGAGLMDDEIISEMICDKIHLCPDMIALAFKIRPIDKIVLITDAMRATGLKDGKYDLGGLEINVESGQARLASSDALAGSVLRFNAALKNVHEVTGLPLRELLKTTALNQAVSLGLEGRGRIEAGYAADIAILNDDFSVEAVFVKGVKRV